MQRFLRIADVKAACGLPTATLYELMDKGEFPRPIKLSSRAVAWIEADVIAWQEQKIAARDAVKEAA